MQKQPVTRYGEGAGCTQVTGVAWDLSYPRNLGKHIYLPVTPGLALPRPCRLFQNTSFALLEVCTLSAGHRARCCGGALNVCTEGLGIVGYGNYQHWLKAGNM